MLNQNRYHLKLFYENGDKGALGKFFSDNFDLIYRVSYHYTKNKADAEDVCQQVMIRVMDTNSKCEAVYGESDKAILGWLSILTANQARMFLRKNKRDMIRTNKKGTEMQEKMEKPKSLREENSANNEEVLEYALAKIPAQYKTVILLKYYNDLSYSEIAETLGLREVTIRSYISKGIEQMRLLLNKKTTTNISTAAILPMIANRRISDSVERKKASLIEKTINSSQSQKLSIINRKQTKSISIFKICTAVVFVSAATLVTFKFFESDKNLQTNTTNTIERNIPFSKSWDFSKDNADDIKVLQGSWSLDHKEGTIAPPDGKELTVEFPFDFLNYYRLEADSFFYDYLIPNDGRTYTFQPSTENGMATLLSSKAFIHLDGIFFKKKATPHKDKIYYSFKTIFYYFDDYLIMSVNPEKPFLAKTKDFTNNAFRISITNLEITKIKYEPMGLKDTKTIKALLKGLEKNVEDQNVFKEVKDKLNTFLAKLPKE